MDTYKVCVTIGGFATPELAERFGFIVSQYLTKDAPPEITATVSHAEKTEHLYQCGECGQPHSQVTHCPFCGSEDLV